jgi:hypothetical protein
MFQGQAASVEGEHPWVGHEKCFTAVFISDYAADAVRDKAHKSFLEQSLF